MTYEQAVEEALCFGWIDSTAKSIDEEKYCQKFTPRNKKSQWSELNISRIKRLITLGKMTSNGLNKIDPSLLDNSAISQNEKNNEIIIPPMLADKLLQHIQASGNFDKLPKSHKKRYIDWLLDAKREETRQKRLREIISLLEKVERLGLK